MGHETDHSMSTLIPNSSFSIVTIRSILFYQRATEPRVIVEVRSREA